MAKPVFQPDKGKLPRQAKEKLLQGISKIRGPSTTVMLPIVSEELQEVSLNDPSTIQDAFMTLVQSLEADATFFDQQSQIKKGTQCIQYILEANDLYRQFSYSDLLLPCEMSSICYKYAIFCGKAGDFQASLEYATRSIDLDPKFEKSYSAAGFASYNLKNYRTAALYFFRKLECAEYDSTELILVDLVILSQCVAHIDDPADLRKIKAFQFHPEVSGLTLSNWLPGLESLYKENEFAALALLTTGNCGMPAELNTCIHKAADIPGMRYNWVDVGHVVKHLKGKEGKTKEWHLRLAYFLVKRGADILKISQAFSLPLLVVMTTLSIEGEVPSFLSLAWERLTCLEYDDKDRMNNTPLHAFVKTSTWKTSKMAEVVLRDLLAKGCLATEKDNRGKMPHELVPTSHAFHKLLLKAATEPGEGLINRLEKIRENSNQALKGKDTTKALDGYSLALGIAEKFPGSLKSQKAVLYSNMAAVHLKENDAQEALKVAEKSIHNDPSFAKSYYRQGQAYTQLKKHGEACKSSLEGFRRAHDVKEKVDFCVQAVAQVCKTSGNQQQLLLKSMKGMLIQVWQKLLEQLTRSGYWNEVNMLVIGPPKFEGGQAIMAEYMCETAELKTIYNNLSRVRFDVWQLLEHLIERSADLGSLAISDTDTRFHAAARLCLHKAMPWDYLFDVESEYRLRSNLIHGELLLDKEGHTLLHTVCIESQKLPPDSEEPCGAFILLCVRGVDRNTRDAHGKMASDYCVPGTKLYNLVMGEGAAKPASQTHQRGAQSRGPNRGNSGAGADARAAGAARASSDTHSWESLKELGRLAYSNHNFPQALELYTKAKSRLETDLRKAGRRLEKLPETESRHLAVLYGNCAECCLNMGDNQGFYENAKQNVNCDGQWYKGHWRLGRASLLLPRPNLAMATRAFVNSYNFLTPSEQTAETQQKLLTDLVEALLQLKASVPQENGDAEIKQVLSRLNPVASSLWVRIALTYIKNQTAEAWRKAEFVFGFTGNPEPVMGKEDLSVFCKKDLLKRQVWVCRIVMWLLQSKAPIGTLKFHPKDHYLHAVLTLVVICGGSPQKHPFTKDLLQYIIGVARAEGKINWQDGDGNTGLHVLAQCKGPCEPMREAAAKLLIDSGIDVLKRGKDGKLAVEMLSMSDSIRDLVKRATDKVTPGFSQSRVHDSGQASNRYQFSRSSPPSGPTKPPNQPNRQSGQPQAATGNRSKGEGAKSKDGITPAKACDDCLLQLKKAQDWQNERNILPMCQGLVKVVRANHKEDGRHRSLRDKSMSLITKMLLHKDPSEIPTCVLEIKAVYFIDLVNAAAEAKRWEHVLNWVVKFKDIKGRDALSKFAQSFSADGVVEDAEMSEVRKVEAVKLFLSHGAGKGKALRKACGSNQWQVALTLLELGADPEGLTLTPGDTPWHAALTIALEKAPGNLNFLTKLKHLWDENSKAYPYLELSSKDENGNSLMHLATKCKFSNHALAVVELLCAWNCPVDLTDQDNHKPLYYLRTNDRRAQFLQSMGSASAGAKPKSTIFSEELNTNTDVVDLRERAQAVLEKLEDVVVNYLEEDGEDEEEEEEEEEEKEEEEEEEEGDEDEQMYSVSDDEPDREDSKKNGDTDDLTIDAKVFDDLLWDVECTEEVWNLLKSTATTGQKTEAKEGKARRKERIPDGMKRIVVSKIQQLASGDWRSHLQRKVHGVPDSLVLHSVHLPGGACILWELAVAFSPKRSEKSCGESLPERSHSQSQQTEGSRGRIYCEIIRVWSIVLQHSEIQRKVKWIVSSHKRGKDCLVQKKLKGLPSSQFTGASSSTRSPVLYMEQDLVELTKDVDQSEKADLQRSLCPPASAQRNEFHILKFYSFSSSLVAAILSNITRKIDFPFRVTDLEYALIHLESPSPILLLGRSGTGKTTCCLYRLWAKFFCYWERALEAGEPLLPQRNPALDIQENEDEDDEETSQEGLATRKSTPPLELKDDYSPSFVQGNGLDYVDSDNDDDDDEKEKEETSSDCEEQTGDESEQAGLRQETYSHLHQLFVTKNSKLCSEVEKNFLKLRHASDTFEEHNMAEKEPLPNTLQMVDELAFPLFLTSRQLLLLLDASVEGDSFFPRDEDLGLKVAIPGWGTQEEIFTIQPLDPDDWLDSDEDDEDGGGKEKGASYKGAKTHHFGEQQKLKTYLCRECTFEIFSIEVWPRISKKAKVDCHPSLVWTEIMSFIQGSFEALGSEGGYLSLDDYLTLGRKRAPNFSGDRHKVYTAFQLYRKYKQDHHLFDESDLVYKIYRRLTQMQYQPWILHEIYVDETQDFTQAELALLLALCQDPNKMFLAGDTAQAIMRGISFRFKDLNSLFHYAKDSIDPRHKRYRSTIKVPKKIHQLRYNYRSHSGILSLASSVLDILQRFFPDSFDPLHRDQGMFAGPKPVVIESCSSENLALLLSGNQHTSSHIEFGAHQAILVTSEESKEQLPQELTSGIVLTIYEAKGLEFDDVLLYNFFKDSQAEKEWRVVTEYLAYLADESTSVSNENILEIDAAVLEQPNRPRPLAFDPDQHKILNSELKHLYTAITRARVNVWIFDEDPQSRGPMFEYFKARKLVQCMGAEGEALSESFMFAQKSSSQQWRKSGDKYMGLKQFALAAKCFGHAGHHSREKLALAYQSAHEASQLRTRPSEMKRQFLKAGVQFVWCGDLHRAAICFQNAREHKLAAIAFRKKGELEAAAVQYQKISSPNEASRCLEQVGMFRKAISVLEDSELYDLAVDCLRRYQLKVKKVQEERGNIPKVLVDNSPKASQSEDELCHRAANSHHKNGNFSKAVAAITRLNNTSDQIAFLERNCYWEEAARILKAEGNTEKAAANLLKAGNLKEAWRVAKDGFHKSLEASVYLTMARKHQEEYSSHQKREANAEDENQSEEGADCEVQGEDSSHMMEKAERFAKRSLDKFTELKDQDGQDGQAQAKLLQGQLTGNVRLLREAGTLFRSQHNYYGEMQSFSARYKLEGVARLLEGNFSEIESKVTSGLKAVYHLVFEELEGLSGSFFGVELHENQSGSRVVTWCPSAFPRCQEAFGQIKAKEVQSPHAFALDIKQAIKELAQHILNQVEDWVLETQTSLRQKCKEICQQPSSPGSMWDHLELMLQDARLDYAWQTQMAQLNSLEVSLTSKLPKPSTGEHWRSAHALMEFLIADAPLSWRLDWEKIRKMADRVRSCDAAVKQILRCLWFEWNNPGRVRRGISSDVIKERCKSTDWVVRAGLISSLLVIWEKLDVQEEVKKLEEKLNTNYQRYRDWCEKLAKYALFSPKYLDDEVIVVEHLSSRYLDSLDYLICGQDAKEALIKFTKMLQVLGQRAIIDLMPHLKHLVFWLEVYFTISWLFVARKSPRPFYLSSSLFSSVEVVNACIQGHSKENRTIQKMLADPNLKFSVDLICNREEYLAHFLVGEAQYSKFSLLSQVPILCEQNGPEVDPTAERIVLLSLLAMLNIPGEFLYGTNRGLIRREFNKLNVEGSLPGVLAELVKRVCEAQTYDEIASAVLDYLDKRYGGTDDRPFLFRCEWVGRPTCPMTWTQLLQDQYPPGIHIPPAETSSTSAHSEADQTDQLTPEELEEEEKEKKKLEAKHETYMRAAEMNLKPAEDGHQEAATRNEASGDDDLEMLFRHCSQVTDTDCEVCKQPLLNSTSPEVLQEEGVSAAGDFAKQGGTGSAFSGRSYANIAGGTETRAQHIESERHSQKMLQFKDFQNFYAEEVHPCVEEIKMFLSNITSKDQVGLNVSRIETSLSEFEKSCRYLFHQRKWDGVHELRESSQQLLKTFLQNKDPIETFVKEQYDKDRLAQEHQEKMEEGMVDVAAFDHTDRPVAGKVKGHGNVRRGQQRKGNNSRSNFQRDIPPRFRKGK